MTDIYAEPAEPALPPTNFRLNPARAALVLTDPQIDFLSPEGVSWRRTCSRETVSSASLRSADEPLPITKRGCATRACTPASGPLVISSAAARTLSVASGPLLTTCVV